MRLAGLKARSAFVTLVSAVGLYACGSSGDSTTSPGNGGTTQTPAIAIALSASSLSIVQGTTAPVTVTLTRSGGFAGDVTLAVDGLPAGATVAGATIAAGQTSAALTVNAGTTATVGTSTITVRASGTGVTATTAAATLVVTAAQTTTPASIALSLAPTTVSLAQGASTTTTINITRSNFTGTVNLAVTGAQSGVTPTLSATAVTANSATLTIAAGATTATGSNTLTVTASGTGISNQTISVPVTITAATSNPSTGSIAWTFCARTGVPVFVAVQDGTGAFTRVTGTNDVYSFNIASGRGAVAYVYPIAGGGFDEEVFYGNTADITAQGLNQCTSAGAGKSVSATLANAAAGDIIIATLSGGAGAVASGNGSVSFAGVPNGLVDLVAGKSSIAFNGTTVTSTLSKALLRRGLNPAAGSTLAAIDFNGSDSFTPLSKNVTINNLGGEITTINSLYVTANNPYAAAFSSQVSPNSTSSATYYGVPAANQATGDLHGLSVVAIPSLTNTNATRQAILFFKDAVDKQVTLGPALTTPVISAITGSSYGRIRCAITVQPEYNKYFTCGSQQGTGTTARTLNITQTANYATGATLNLDAPDLSSVTGFDVNYGLKAGVSSTATVTATTFSGNTVPAGTQYVEGLSVLSATKISTVTP